MNRVREFRKKAGLTQAQLAKKADVSTRLIISWEQGWRDFGKGWVSNAIRVAKALGTTVEQLAGEDDN